MKGIDRVVSRILTETGPAVRDAHEEMEARQKAAAEKSAEDFRAWRVGERERLRPFAEQAAAWLEQRKEDGTLGRIDSALKALTTLPRWWSIRLMELGRGREVKRLLLDASTGSLVYERRVGVVGHVRTERTRAASAVELREFPASLLSRFGQLAAAGDVEQVIVTQLEEAERLALERS